MQGEFWSDIGQESPSSETLPTSLLPTPTTKMNQGAPSMMKQGKGCRLLRHMLLPTPGATLAQAGARSRSGDRKDEPLLGAIANMSLLPTPTSDGSARKK